MASSLSMSLASAASVQRGRPFPSKSVGGYGAMICPSPINRKNRGAYPTQLQVTASGKPTDRWQSAGAAAVSIAAAAVILGSSSAFNAVAEGEFETYYGTAASASSYGGYGGNASKRDSAEYIYDVPAGWKERNVSKVEKGTNGTDSEWFNPKKRVEKTYLTFLSGFRKLPLQENVLNNLALSDVNLQDQIGTADSVESRELTGEDGQPYYEFEIDSPVGHSLISVTCAKNKLYVHFVNAPQADWNRDKEILKHVHESFKTIGISPPS